jgi:hypothetical protein
MMLRHGSEAFASDDDERQRGGGVKHNAERNLSRIASSNRRASTSEARRREYGRTSRQLIKVSVCEAGANTVIR